MKISKTIYTVLFFIFLSILCLNLTAFDDGIVGFTKKNRNENGCICHELLPERHVTVFITGPASVTVNDTALYTLRISGGPAVAGGCDIATNLGKVYPSPLDTMLIREERYPGTGYDLTHKDPKLFTGSYVEFIFKYVAPQTPGVTDTIYANGNSVNFDLSSFGDQWNYAENFVVSITDIPQPVELSSFTSSVAGINADLIWTTSSEENNAGFDIERSDVSGNWIKKGFLKGKGNSITPVNYSYTDKKLMPGKYFYRLKQTDFNGNFRYYFLNNEVEISNPAEYFLSQNYPNPFNPSTVISYQLTVSSFTKLVVYDVMGREVITLVNEKQGPGTYEVEFDAENLTSGVYFYRLKSTDFTDTKRMVLVR